MPLAASSASRALPPHPEGGWWFRGAAAAGTTDRLTNHRAWFQRRHGPLVEAEQVHGAGIAAIEACEAPSILLRASSRAESRDAALCGPVAGCDALMTSQPGVTLLIRTADCLPIFFVDAARGVVALAHVGWRGLAAQLPMRVVAAMSHVYRSHASDLRVAIGPAIRACCYEVGPEVAQPFGPWVRVEGGRRRCDLIGAAAHQLCCCGVRADRLVDSGLCTACDPARWFSLRREGPATGRLLSFICMKP